MTENPKKSKILIVDDGEVNPKIMQMMLRDYGYVFDTAKSGQEALQKTFSFSPDLIYLDLVMPEMDGYEVCQRLKQDPVTQRIPVAVVTSLSDKESRIRAFELGANDFLTKPIDGAELMARTKSLLKVKEYSDFLTEHNEILSSEVKEKTGQLKEAYIDSIYRLTFVAEYKDEDTALHIKRVSNYCAALAQKLGLPDDDVEAIYYSSPMHDIGKVGIPSDILLKPGKLNNEEFALMRTHTVIGGRILHGSPSKVIHMGERIALSHHERWDGSGYPQGIKGKEIPREGLIAGIADVYDALRSGRPYKPPYEHKKTCEIMIQGDGRTKPSHFDPEMLEIFKNSNEDFEKIYETHKSA